MGDELITEEDCRTFYFDGEPYVKKKLHTFAYRKMFDTAKEQKARADAAMKLAEKEMMLRDKAEAKLEKIADEVSLAKGKGQQLSIVKIELILEREAQK